MTVKLGINGFGRIGRCLARAIYELGFNNIKLVAINTPASATNCAHLLKYDSIHGRFNFEVTNTEDSINIINDKITLIHKNSINEINWKELGVDIVMECSGLYNSVQKSSLHLHSGCKKVIISAPISDDGKTIIYGVNHTSITKDDNVISIGSCTTNCLAPIVELLHKTIGIEKGFMHTVHSYTNDQNVVDNNHKKDLRRARACALSMIPSTTGATDNVVKVIPELKGKLSGTATRVPTPNVSMVDFSFVSSKHVDPSMINDIMYKASKNELKGIVDVCNYPLVSIDFIHNSHSAIFDSSGTFVVDNNFCRIMSWYDNEWGFAARMLDVVNFLSFY